MFNTNAFNEAMSNLEVTKAKMEEMNTLLVEIRDLLMEQNAILRRGH